ncbi:MAG: glycerol-3-phosphate acyltransferase [bacterium]
MMEYIFCALAGYLIGSFPTGYVFLKKFKKIDITLAGTGNVGAMNSFEVTNSKMTGIIVLSVDLLKGMLSVILVEILFGVKFNFAMISLTSAVLAHCYSPWIKFKGGRGLATAAGGSLVLSPLILVIWSMMWLLTYLVSKNIHIGNAAASLLTAGITFIFGQAINRYSILSATSILFFEISVCILMLIILSRHIEPLMEIFIKQKIDRK